MAGRKRELEAPIILNIILEANTVVKVDRQVAALSKKAGFKVSRSELIREIITNYLNVSGV